MKNKITIFSLHQIEELEKEGTVYIADDGEIEYIALPERLLKVTSIPNSLQYEVEEIAYTERFLYEKERELFKQMVSEYTLLPRGA